MRNRKRIKVFAAAFIALELVYPVKAQCDQWESFGTGAGIPPSGTVNCLAVYQGELVAGGNFPDPAPRGLHNVAVWDRPKQGWRSLGTGTDGSLNALDTYDGELIAAGWFIEAGDQITGPIARWNGSVWQSVGGGVNAPIFDLAVYNDELIASGWFSYAGGVEAHGMARWNGTVWRPMHNGLNFIDGLYSLTEFNGSLYGREFNKIWRWNDSTETWQLLATQFNGHVQALVVYNGELVAGGSFNVVNGQPAGQVAGWNGSTWHAFGAGIRGFGVNTLAVYNGDLIAGGTFTTAGGQIANSIARWNGSAWLPWGSGILRDAEPGWVSSLAVYNDELVVGGGFTSAGETPANNIARWRNCHMCLPDVTLDNQVNVDDLLSVIAGWGPCPAQSLPCPADISPQSIYIGDGVVDAHDLFWLINHWGVCPAPPFPCPYDIVQTGIVNADDLLALINAWGPCQPPAVIPCPADATHNGKVNVDDLLAVINAWGPCH